MAQILRAKNGEDEKEEKSLEELAEDIEEKAKDIEKGVSAYAFRMKHGRELPANFKNFFFIIFSIVPIGQLSTT